MKDQERQASGLGASGADGSDKRTVEYLVAKCEDLERRVIELERRLQVRE